jgi:hypothetical protein
MRLLTSEELMFTSAPPFPFSDSFREEDLDEEELSAFRARRQREEERKRSVLARTPCRICGRFVDPGEPCNIDVVARGAWLHDEDGTVVAEGPTALVYCSQHRS